MFNKIITTSLFGNADKQQLKACLGFIVNPFKWRQLRRGHEMELLENDFKKFLGQKKVLTFNSGRTALYYLLKSFGVGPGDEVIIQAYTCVSVPNAILWLGAKPVYVDIKDDFNLDEELIQEKINIKTKALIIQNTFGSPAAIGEIQKIAWRNHIILIEDGAHSLGAEYHGQKIGTFGDGAIFSFGRDKVISGVSGGLTVCRDEKVFNQLKKFHSKLREFKVLETLLHLLHPLYFYLIGRTYNFLSFGKILALVNKKIGFLPLVLTKQEKKGQLPEDLFAQLPNSLAKLVRFQFAELRKRNAERISKANYYEAHLKNIPNLILPLVNNNSVNIFLRYTIRVSKGDDLRKAARAENIFLGDWYNQVIAPKDVDLNSVGYQLGSCPKAEKMASESVNLPNHRHITSGDQDKIINFLKNYLGKNDTGSRI